MFEDEESLMCPGADDIADLIGNERTIRLGNAIKWNKACYVPRGPLPDDHIFVRTIGRLWAELLQQEFAGESICIPKCYLYQIAKRNEAIRSEAARGDSIETIAKRHALSASTVVRALRSVRKVRIKKDLQGGNGRGSFSGEGEAGGKSGAKHL